ncbi:hypothetical protein ES703_93951 [subsurface metagenome]
MRTPGREFIFLITEGLTGAMAAKPKDGRFDTMGRLRPVIFPSVAANWAGSISTRMGWTGREYRRFSK